MRMPTAGWRLWLLLAIPPVLVYANSLHNPFHYDDAHSIVDNEHIRDLSNIPQYFIDPTLFASEPRYAMYRPLLLTSVALNHALGEYEVAGYHVFAILLHIGCVLLVHDIALRLLGEGGRRSALAAALIFGLHPIASEPVNYISSRSELLVALLLFASLSAFLRRRAQGGLSLAGANGTLGMVFGGYGAALLSKATAVALPAVILVYALLFHRDMVRRDSKLYGGMALLSGLYLWMIIGQFHKATVGSPVRGYDEQLWSQVKALLLYLRLLLFPTGLSVDHQFLISDSLIDPFAFASTLLLGTTLVVCWRAGIRGRRLPLFLVLWFLVSLAPASLVPLNVLVNEHRLYIPLAAFAIALGWGLERIGPRGIGLAAVAGRLLSYGCMTSARNLVWGSVERLWMDAADKAPLMARPHFFLAEHHVTKGRPELAVAAYRRGLSSDSTFADGYVRLGELYTGLADMEQAETALQKARDLEPQRGELWGHLGAHYRDRALSQGDEEISAQWWQRSLSAYERAALLKPGDQALLNNLGTTYQVVGRFEEALAAHERALQIDPGNAETLLNLGNDHWYLGNPGQARLIFERAVSAAPDYAAAWFSLALMRQETGDNAGAAHAYTRAVQLNPQYTAAVEERLRSLAPGARDE